MISYVEKLAYLLSLKNIGSTRAEKILQYDSNSVNPTKEFLTNLYNNSYLRSLLGNYKIHLIGRNDPNYPIALRNISYVPKLLFAIGNINLLSKKRVTIVGTRDITSYGKRIIDDILSLKDIPSLVYVSGLAKGIDAEVHKIALKNNLSTIAVVAGGIDQGFPRENELLYKEIVESGRGLILAEFPPGRVPIKGMFPMRNRILAGLSDLTVIVEAGDKSGAMITAQYAVDFGRDVATLPNSIFDKNFLGNNKLIEDGAYMLRSKVDYIQLINRILKFQIGENSQIGDTGWKNSLLQDIKINEYPLSVQNYFKYLVEKEIDTFTFESMLLFVNKNGEISTERLYSYLTKAEMHGILSLNNIGAYKVNRYEFSNSRVAC